MSITQGPAALPSPAGLPARGARGHRADPSPPEAQPARTVVRVSQATGEWMLAYPPPGASEVIVATLARGLADRLRGAWPAGPGQPVTVLPPGVIDSLLGAAVLHHAGGTAALYCAHEHVSASVAASLSAMASQAGITRAPPGGPAGLTLLPVPHSRLPACCHPVAAIPACPGALARAYVCDSQISPEAAEAIGRLASAHARLGPDSDCRRAAALPCGVLPVPGLAGAPANPVVLRTLLGIQLRRLREAAGITPEQAGAEVHGSPSRISRMEAGRAGLEVRDVAALLTLYGVTDGHVRSVFCDQARESARPGWWAEYGSLLPDWFETFLGLESAASTIRSFEIQFVNALFQTEDYARAVTRLGHRSAPPAEIEQRVALRLRRQELLSRATPPKVWAVMDESVLRRPVGGLAVLRAQLRRLVEIARLPHVTIQVVPFAWAGQAGESGSFSVMRFEEPDLPDIVHIEQLASAIFLDERPGVEHYLENMDHYCWHALAPAASLAFHEQAALQA